jgi:hypothetical protein
MRLGYGVEISVEKIRSHMAPMRIVTSGNAGNARVTADAARRLPERLPVPF